MANPGTHKKRPCSKRYIDKNVWSNSTWSVHYGELKRDAGHPGRVRNLFQCLGELVPFAALDDVRKSMAASGIRDTGVYIAHDSMGCPRYAGRGNIFHRLAVRRKAQKHELAYFSFYVVEEKKHEREIETLVIRAAGFLLDFNERKKRAGIWPGSLFDYEAGTHFFVRHQKKGRTTAE